MPGRGDLGHRDARMTLDPSGQYQSPYGAGKWVGVIDPLIWSVGTGQFEAWHIVITGPPGSALQVWIDRTSYSGTPRGDVNEYDPTHPIPLSGGQTLYFYWNTGATPAPTASVFIRERTAR